MLCFNTQPPEGGWKEDLGVINEQNCFNTQPPEGGWEILSGNILRGVVSTHSRLKAAGAHLKNQFTESQSFNTQPPEGGWGRVSKYQSRERGFNTQPPEGGWGLYTPRLARPSSFNTQPPEGGWLKLGYQETGLVEFQHTAA